MNQFDPIELELFKNLFTSITEEMAAVLQRTALSPNIKERRDFSCALFTRLGETFAQGSHIPVHLGAMPLSVQAALQAVDFEPGDVVILNDPYKGGTHLPDITCIQPYFVDGNLCFLVANRAHHSDVGGITPGSMPLATEIFQEGVIIPPLKLYRRGRLNEEALSLFLANVRTPEERRGDILAQVAANSRGARRLGEMLSRYGLEKLTLYADQIQDYTERILRETIKAIPDGRYEFEDYLDDDGVNRKTVKVRVALTIKNDEAWVDFSDSSEQVAGSINANYAVTYSAVLYVFRSLVEEDIPFNTGLMKPVKIIAPEGSVVNATFPSALAGGNVETSQRIVDVLLGALALALPGKIPAASQGTMNNLAFGGFNPQTRTNFAYYETIGGGMGASSLRPGLSGVHCHMTNSLNTPIEALENYLPIKIRKYALRKNSGGAGSQRGGDGLIREYQFQVPVNLTIISDRRKLRPYGLAGGLPGRAGVNLLIRRGRRKTLGSKVNLKLEAGDILRIETPGGGGYGRPEE
ncbi:MAG: hydantoinase B/oxoprolinase family protein [Candidatus Saccharicenans sp.]|nr:hydantoinase B/oxoprolinase family protein [Candidatus Saccharicenans sp.]